MHTASTFSFARALVLAVVVGIGCRSDSKLTVRPSPPSVIITKPADGTETYPYRDIAFEAEVTVRDGSDVSEVEARWVGNDTVLLTGSVSSMASPASPVPGLRVAT